MTRRQRKLFDQNMPGNYMPANREGWLMVCIFIGIALGVLIAGHLLGQLLDSPWPSRASWAVFLLVTIRFVFFVKRHS